MNGISILTLTNDTNIDMNPIPLSYNKTLQSGPKYGLSSPTFTTGPLGVFDIGEDFVVEPHRYSLTECHINLSIKSAVCIHF